MWTFSADAIADSHRWQTGKGDTWRGRVTAVGDPGAWGSDGAVQL